MKKTFSAAVALLAGAGAIYFTTDKKADAPEQSLTQQAAEIPGVSTDSVDKVAAFEHAAAEIRQALKTNNSSSDAELQKMSMNLDAAADSAINSFAGGNTAIPAGNDLHQQLQNYQARLETNRAAGISIYNNPEISLVADEISREAGHLAAEIISSSSTPNSQVYSASPANSFTYVATSDDYSALDNAAINVTYSNGESQTFPLKPYDSAQRAEAPANLSNLVAQTTGFLRTNWVNAPFAPIAKHFGNVSVIATVTKSADPDRNKTVQRVSLSTADGADHEIFRRPGAPGKAMIINAAPTIK